MVTTHILPSSLIGIFASYDYDQDMILGCVNQCRCQVKLEGRITSIQTIWLMRLAIWCTIGIMFCVLFTWEILFMKVFNAIQNHETLSYLVYCVRNCCHWTKLVATNTKDFLSISSLSCQLSDTKLVRLLENGRKKSKNSPI